MNDSSLEQAIAFHQQGALQQASDIYSQILQDDPDHADANHLMGLLAHQSGNHELAAQLLLKAIHSSPTIHPLYFDNLATICISMGKLEDAANCYQEIIRSQPDQADAYRKLGNTRLQQGNLSAAVIAFRQAVRIMPNDASVHNSLGVAWLKQGQLLEAEKSLREAILVDADYHEAYGNLAIALKEQSRLEDAEAILKHSLHMSPQNASNCYNLANILSIQGKIQEAQAAYCKTLSIKPDYTEAFRCLSRLKKYACLDDETKKFTALYQNPDLLKDKKMHLGFALGKIHEDIGQYDAAFAYLSEANTLFRSSYNYTLKEDRAFFELLMSIFDQHYMRQYADSGNSDATPIFIVGMPRSGTSLVEQILASHAQVYGAGELEYLKQIVWQSCEGDAASGFNFLENIKKLNAHELKKMGDAYISKMRSHSANSRFISDKMPHNFFYLGVIKTILPQAKIIHCQRDPLDNCFSIYKNYFSSSQRYAYDLSELGEYYACYQTLMDHWHQVLPENSIYDVQYEKIVENPQEQIKDLLQHCELAWDEKCLSFHNTERAVKTASIAQVRQPMHQQSVKLWKHYEQHLHPLLESLNKH